MFGSSCSDPWAQHRLSAVLDHSGNRFVAGLGTDCRVASGKRLPIGIVPRGLQERRVWPLRQPPTDQSEPTLPLSCEKVWPLPAKSGLFPGKSAEWIRADSISSETFTQTTRIRAKQLPTMETRQRDNCSYLKLDLWYAVESWCASRKIRRKAPDPRRTRMPTPIGN